MCISGLDSGDILCWILPLVSVEKSAGRTVESFRNCRWTENTHFLHTAPPLQLPPCFGPLPRLFTSSPLADLPLDPTLLHKANTFLCRISGDQIWIVWTLLALVGACMQAPAEAPSPFPVRTQRSSTKAHWAVCVCVWELYRLFGWSMQHFYLWFISLALWTQWLPFDWVLWPVVIDVQCWTVIDYCTGNLFWETCVEPFMFSCQKEFFFQCSIIAY